MTDKQEDLENSDSEQLLTLQVSADLYRAFQRCTWVIINETGRSRLEIMDEMIRDFLVKHGC